LRSEAAKQSSWVAILLASRALRASRDDNEEEGGYTSI